MNEFWWIFWRDAGAWPKEESFKFWWRSRCFRGSWIIFQDSLPSADRAWTDTLQSILASYERMLMSAAWPRDQII